MASLHALGILPVLVSQETFAGEVGFNISDGLAKTFENLFYRVQSLRHHAHKKQGLAIFHEYF